MTNTGGVARVTVMARLARLVIPGLPHHITRRGNRRQQTFFNDDDDSACLTPMSPWCTELGVPIWSYCLVANHVHLIAVPKTEDGLRRLQATGDGS
jgi:putative transposase